VNEFDDLDQLEREFGSALRVALRRVAADIPDDASVWSPGPIARLRHVDTDHLDPDEQLVPLNEVTGSASTATGQTRNRRRLLIAAAAVVVAIGIAGIAQVITNDDDDQSPAPVATVSVAPTTSVATETVSFAVKNANDIPVTFTKPKSWGVLGLTDWPFVPPEPPTTDTSHATTAPVTTAPDPNQATTPPEPRVPGGAYSNVTQHGAVVQFASVSNIYSDGCRWPETLLDPPVGPTVDDLVTAWANIPQLAPTTAVDITVDGYTGKQIELTVPDYDPVSDPASCGVWGPFGFGLWTYGDHGQPLPSNAAATPHRHFQMLVLDVDGTRLLIAASTDPNTLPQDRAALEELLASIQIAPPATVAPTTPSATVVVTDSDLGQIVTDSDGWTLYLVMPDAQSAPTCTDSCAATWRPFIVTGVSQVTAGDGVDESLLGTVERGAGTQVTYNGWPLYFFNGDSAPGDTNGQGLGGVSYVIDPTGNPVRPADRQSSIAG
jgi:predicted lipoprotein with Yx(FWY)xxD motif